MIEMLLRKCLMLAQPIGLIWLLLSLWLGFSLFRRGSRPLLPALAWLILTAMTCTPLASWLLADMEMRFAPVRIETLPEADAILCLGGGAEPSLNEPTGIHLKVGADRIPTALLLAARKKGGALVLGGGGYPQDGERLSEADALATHLQRQESGIPIISLGLCWDTRDEALKFAELAQERGWKNVLLVTSASHMPRAAATFAKAGVEVIPVPCDYQSSFHRVGKVDWVHLPHAQNFQVFAIWFHEIVGRWVYEFRDWI